MTRAELLALAARVEAAQGADRELDALIYDAVGHFAWWDAIKVVKRSPDRHEALMMNVRASNFAPTASLDAAASLVPEGWRWSVETLSSAGPLGLCEHWPQSGQRHPYTRGEAATPALALTAAALRARAEEVGDA